MYFALFYDTVDDYVERRKPFRAEHLALAEEARAAGKLVMAGAFDPADAALFVWDVASEGDVEDFVRRDPYVKNGVVRSWRVRRWSVVVGGRA